MGTLRSPNIEFCAGDARMGQLFTHANLLHAGMNFQVSVSQSDTLLKALDAPTQPSTLVFAHLDTGASLTSIDINLARHMGLTPVGTTSLRTAGGIVEFPNFIVDIVFPSSTLAARANLPICSCDMGFDINKPLTDVRNFGVLIGRDIMALWNIVWNGPTSTVIIND